jgi:hypothetical protein
LPEPVPVETITDRPARGEADRLFLMAHQDEVRAEETGGLRADHALAGELAEALRALEGGVEFQDRLGPEPAAGELRFDEGAKPRLAHPARSS